MQVAAARQTSSGPTATLVSARRVEGKAEDGRVLRDESETEKTQKLALHIWIHRSSQDRLRSGCDWLQLRLRPAAREMN